ncbi:MerR family transcriptional regulator [Saccharopolyspora taberi]|uniref:HTH merR-type domain-containing protein n=1 Tax=Saccharopolyspora taberi TaxID=60895 RepID=A0ABN3VDP0_9PSEU
MNIGQFAQLTGLSLKALRLYDEQGLLRPAAVDPWSRYRRYTARQLTTAVRLKALRAADVPLAEAGRALEGQSAAVLAEHRERLATERARQDAALEAAEALLSGDEQRWRVEERQAHQQHWVAVVLPVDDDEDDEAGTERANSAYTALWSALEAEGNRPVGGFWSSLRARTDGEVELLCCWPVAGPPPTGWTLPGWAVQTGLVPEGRELVVRWRHDDPVPAVDGAVHPAVLALLAEAERRGTDLDLAQLRQIGLLDESGDSVGVEVSVAVG